jgi:hypothetical protein
MQKITFTALIIISLSQTALSQTGPIESKSFYINDGSKSELGFNFNIYKNDFYLGGAYRIQPSGLGGVSFFTEFHFRPYAKRVLSQESEKVYYIFKEHQFQFYLGSGYSIKLFKDLDLQMTLAINPLGAYYRGSNKKFADLIAPVFELGVGTNSGKYGEETTMINWAIGYRYRNSITATHGLFIKFYFPIFQ